MTGTVRTNNSFISPQTKANTIKFFEYAIPIAIAVSLIAWMASHAYIWSDSALSNSATDYIKYMFGSYIAFALLLYCGDKAINDIKSLRKPIDERQEKELVMQKIPLSIN